MGVSCLSVRTIFLLPPCLLVFRSATLLYGVGLVQYVQAAVVGGTACPAEGVLFSRRRRLACCLWLAGFVSCAGAVSAAGHGFPAGCNAVAFGM